MAECYTLFLNASKTLPGGMYLTYVPQGILPSVVDIGRSMNGGNLFGLERVPQVWVDLYMTYAHTSDTAEATRIVEELGREMQGVIDRAGAGLDFIFPSTAGEGQKVLRGYGMVGGGGREEVERVAGVYDKGGVMQRLQSGGYLLRDV